MKDDLLIYSPRYHSRKYVITVLSLLCAIILIFLIINPQIKVIGAIGALVLIGGAALYISNTIDKKQLLFSLTKYHLQYHSNKGGWCVKWHDINAIGIASIRYEGWDEQIPWCGIQLKTISPLLASISLRLASRILFEQRGLLLMAYRKQENPTLKELEDIVFDDTAYVCENGIEYQGLLAMLANRMILTRQLLGYDILISESILDRSCADFVGLTRQYLASARHLINE